VYYVFVPQVTNAIDPTLTAISQGVILLAVLFLLPGGLVSLPNVIRRLTRRRTTRSSQGAPPQTAPAQHPPAETVQEGPENTERQSRS
jgi:branched-chain amino acid transport system permease protein